MTFSARLNDDDSWRGLGWTKESSHPVVLVGINSGEYFWTRREAIRAAKAKAVELGLIEPQSATKTP